MGKFFNSSGIYVDNRRKEWTPPSRSSRVSNQGMNASSNGEPNDSPDRLVMQAHSFTNCPPHLEFTIEFIFAHQQEQQMQNPKFWDYFGRYPRYRALRFCSFPPGDCWVCDDKFVNCVEQLLEKNVDTRSVDQKSVEDNAVIVGERAVESESLMPYTDFLENNGMNMMFEPRRRYVKHDWTSQRPCHEFMAYRICRYGSNCRFSHPKSMSEFEFSTPPPRIRQQMPQELPVVDFRLSLPHAQTPFSSPAQIPQIARLHQRSCQSPLVNEGMSKSMGFNQKER